ncbi:hypothetical protein [Microbacterium lacus]|uniref:hypothetical protein n=1 Tax=Microbacterium lacus TaxID=415217 RepID=UPI000C2C72E2|nr:hypothetical protein [Microbacterium lacus]
MTPEIVVGLFVLIGGVIATVATLVGGILRNRSERSVTTAQTAQADLAARFDDASELSKYIDERVELKVAPIRKELIEVKRESHEMHDAVRAHFTQLWAWDQRGRVGPLPLLPAKILTKLGLGHLLEDEWQTEPNQT